MVKRNKFGRIPKSPKEQDHEKPEERLENAYKFIERREVTGLKSLCKT